MFSKDGGYKGFIKYGVWSSYHFVRISDNKTILFEDPIDYAELHKDYKIGYVFAYKPANGELVEVRFLNLEVGLEFLTKDTYDKMIICAKELGWINNEAK